MNSLGEKKKKVKWDDIISSCCFGDSIVCHLPVAIKNVNAKFLIKTRQKLCWICISCLWFALLYFIPCLPLLLPSSVNAAFHAHLGDVIICRQSNFCLAKLFSSLSWCSIKYRNRKIFFYEWLDGFLSVSEGKNVMPGEGRMKLWGLCHVLVPFRLWQGSGTLFQVPWVFEGLQWGCFSFRSLGKSKLHFLLFGQSNVWIKVLQQRCLTGKAWCGILCKGTKIHRKITSKWSCYFSCRVIINQ